VDEQLIYDWATTSYGLAGCYSFAQMEFNDGKMHLSYLGLVDGAPSNSGCWLRHPYYTSCDKNGENWTQTQYIINSLDYIDLEFAYLTSAGFSDDIWYLMAQVDSYAGVHECYGTGCDPEHDPVKNTFYFFPYGKYDPKAVGEITKLSMSVVPNPASGNVTVKDFDKGNITVYNMLGQTVYHVENVVKEVSIPLNNLSSGVYFVTLRSGSATTTQKLIVK